MRVLITGATGFIGRFLAKQCLESGCDVLGMGTESPGEEWPKARFEYCDVRHRTRFQDLITTFRPERIFHLAAQSYPTVSLEQPYETMEINAGGTINLFECLRTAGIRPMVVVACSSAEYGPVDSRDLPVKEEHPLRPVHPYGVSKVAQDLLGAQYWIHYSLPCVRIRIFNTTGPSKLGDVCSDLTKRATEIELGIRPPVLPAGNLTSRRAIIDVRDTARALWLAADRCEAGEVYNVGAHRIYAVSELIETVRSLAGIRFTVQRDESLVRSCDEPVIAGDISKFHRATGWKAEIDLVGTIREMFDWWRHKLTRLATGLHHKPGAVATDLVI